MRFRIVGSNKSMFKVCRLEKENKFRDENIWILLWKMSWNSLDFRDSGKRRFKVEERAVHTHKITPCLGRVSSFGSGAQGIGGRQRLVDRESFTFCLWV